MKSRSLWLLLPLIFQSISSARADVIARSQPDRRLYAILTDTVFEPDDPVCVYVDGVKVVCGDVFRVAGKGIVVFVLQGDYRFLRDGQKVEVRRQFATPKSRSVVAGADYLFPYVHFQQLVKPNLAYGFIGEGVIFKKDDFKMKGIIAMLSLSYYGGPLMTGAWLMAAGGIHIVNLQPASAEGEASRDGITSLLAQLNVGWRFRLGSVTVGLGVGGKYFMAPNLHPITYYNGFLPSGILDIGYIF